MNLAKEGNELHNERQYIREMHFIQSRKEHFENMSSLYTTKINSKERHVQYLLKFNKCSFCDGLPWWLSGKESYCNAGYINLIPGLGRSSGERMADHSSIPAWEIPWTEEPGGLQSMGLKTGHDLVTKQLHFVIQ